MGRTPNYRFDRMERDRAKAGKKAEKQAAKEEARKKAREAADGGEIPPADPSDTE
jgi:hypothetical protein